MSDLAADAADRILSGLHGDGGSTSAERDYVIRHVREALAAEREAGARLCDATVEAWKAQTAPYFEGVRRCAEDLAAAIRARE